MFLVPAKAVRQARLAFADDLPVASQGRYSQKRYHPEVPNLVLGTQLLQAMHAAVVVVIWGPPFFDDTAGDMFETVVGQVYARGAGATRMLGYTLYYLVLGVQWTDADIDQETTSAGVQVARALEALLGGR